MALGWSGGELRAGHGERRIGRLVLALMIDERLTDPLASAQAMRPGSWVILRFPEGKPCPAFAIPLRNLCRQRRLKFIVARDWRLADRLAADGLHLPQQMARSTCLSPCLAWLRAKRQRCLTMAAHDRQGLALAARLPVEAVFLSPVFPTASHPEARPIGPLKTRLWIAGCKKPVFALGGIDPGSIGRLGGCGLSGAGAISALQPDRKLGRIQAKSRKV